MSHQPHRGHYDYDARVDPSRDRIQLPPIRRSSGTDLPQSTQGYAAAAAPAAPVRSGSYHHRTGSAEGIPGVGVAGEGMGMGGVGVGVGVGGVGVGVGVNGVGDGKKSIRSIRSILED